jgi:gamma-glutamyltranspeptidase/glutathione hydrolase
VLAEGGNAVDACVAAAFASWVVESPLTGPGGGGFMLVHRARDSRTRLLDFFAATPGLGRRRAQASEMESIALDFDREGSQMFHIGAASCAVPGTPLGLETAHRAFGVIPWRRLAEPAVAVAREGIVLTAPQAYLHALIDVILRHTAEGRRIYGEAERLVAGDRLMMGDLGGAIERLAEHGAADFYTGELARTIVRDQREHGGEITLRDLETYRVIWRRPLRCGFAAHEFVSNPPPSSGGVLIAYGLRLLDELGIGGPPGSAGAVACLAQVMREQTRARAGPFASRLHRGGLARRLLSDEAVREAAARIRSGEGGFVEAAAGGGTTHISVVDGKGNAASLSTSTGGGGSGVIVPGTGIHLNNMLGEFDLALGLAPRPGSRMTSMMAPSLVLAENRPRLVVGSAGSIRLRGAIMQIVLNVVAHGMPVEEAIAHPRVHLEEPHVHCEGGHAAAEIDRVAAQGFDVVRWRRRNLYFGGAQAVEWRDDGTLAAAGDPRRGGAGMVVA